MTSSDPQAFLLELLRQQSLTPWLFFILPIIGAAIGSYASSYLRKRGEDKAAQENFDAIRAQLATTTRDTEEIKQHLSGRTWRSQQQWAARERYYSNLLTQLHRFKIALESLFDYYLEPGSEHTADSTRGDGFKKLLADASTAYTETQKLVGPAAIFLSAHASVNLEELFRAHWNLATFSASCTYEYIEGASKLADNAYNQILAEAKTHLGIVGDA
jgi:hypothetical protein